MAAQPARPRPVAAVLLVLLLAVQRGRGGSVNTEYMSHAPQRTDLPPECAQVYGLLERCRARVATRNVIERAFNALGYGGCAHLETKVLSCARHFRGGAVDADPQEQASRDRSHGQFSGDWERSELDQLRAPPRRSRKDGLTAEVFHKEYLSKGRPVMITDAAEDWPALVRRAPTLHHCTRVGRACRHVPANHATCCPILPAPPGLGLHQVRKGR
jgi:hypothetical protein